MSDLISKQAVLNILDDMVKDYIKENDFDKAQGVAWVKVQKLPPVTPKGVTVTDFADKCRECGREKVLDKIKEEIRELATFDTVDVLVEVNKIIDKYKTEREVKDGRLDGRGTSKG